MALITRMSQLFQADLHAVLDRIEEPDALLRRAVREMQEVLAGDEQHVKRLEHEQGQLLARQNDLEHSLSEIDEQLDICFMSDQDDLARKLIKRKLEAQHFASFLSRKRQTLEESLSGLKTRVAQNQARLDSMRQKAELLAGVDGSVPSEERWATPDFPVHEEDVEVALLWEKQRRSRS